MHAQDVADATGWSLRSAQRHLAHWHARQHHDPTLPRVAVVRIPVGRPRYDVSRAELDRWLLGGAAPGIAA